MTRSGRSGVPGDSSWLLNFLANEHSMNGAHAEAVTAAEAGARSRGGLTRAAHVYAALGDTPRALDMVEAASRERRPDVNFRCSITHRVLQGEPRMRELMRSSGFPAAN